MNEFSKFIEDKTMRAKKKFEIEKNGNEEIETEIATHTRWQWKRILLWRKKREKMNLKKNEDQFSISRIFFFAENEIQIFFHHFSR